MVLCGGIRIDEVAHHVGGWGIGRLQRLSYQGCVLNPIPRLSYKK